MLVGAFCFAAGVLWARLVWNPPWLLLGAIVAGATFGIVELVRFRRRYVGGAMVAVAVACCGALAYHGEMARPPAAPELMRYATGQPVTISGTVIRDGEMRTAIYGGQKQTVDIAVDSVETEAGMHAVSGGVRVGVYVPSQRRKDVEDEDDDEATAVKLPLLRYGDRVRLTAKLNVPVNYGNPGAMDYRGYLRANGIFAVGSARSTEVAVVARDGGSRLGRWRAQAKRAIVGKIHSVWPADQAALMDAMLIGDASRIDHETRGDFQRSGTYHVLVVSGMNVGILAFVVFWVLRRVRVGEGWATLLTVLLALAYSYLADAGAPVMRATLMLAIYLVTRLFYRDRAALNAVGFAGLLLLATTPTSLFEPSFQLTFLAVVGIAGVALPVLDASSNPCRRALRMLGVIGYDQSLEPRWAQFRLDLRMVSERLARVLGRRTAPRLVVGTISALLSVFEVVVVSAVMQVVLALPMAWYFHRATIMALPANVLVVPLTGVLMPAAALALALAFIHVRLALLPSLVAGWALNGITGAVRVVGTLRVGDLRVPQPALIPVLVCGVTIVLGIVVMRQRRWGLFLGAAAIAASAAWVVMAGSVADVRRGALEITAIDVGQGDSFLLTTPEGNTLLVDSGGQLGSENTEFDIGEDVVSPYLWSRGLSRLDAVAVSHTHADHMGGMAAVIRNFRPRELWLGPGADVKERQRLLQVAQEQGVRVVLRSAGDHWTFGGADFAVVWPSSGDFGPKVRDDDAMVICASYGTHSMLLPGDIGKKAEEALLSKIGRSELLKVAHHGSATSTSAEWLKAIQPQYALISAGQRNRFRHPRPEVLGRLAAAHVKTYRTDLFGAVRIRMDTDGVEVTPSVLETPLR